ncbi:putative quorum-sensing-regulated virulence factor [Alicyclobacillus tolerans]|uniref:putative quorum-sensing-regulated virulence factor n=1 Tax=Alicyclobacillus tolerans TaxID=90970 RepID=UPI0009354E42|nr:DUF3820 family protein [Alicyclobacillus montanus]
MRIQDTRFVVLDTETTGLDPTLHRIVDISLVEVSRNGIRPLYQTLVNPQQTIPPEASEVHHITDRQVKDKPTWEEVWPTVLTHIQDAVLVAHNAKFDRSFLPETHRPWICSYRLARHLWPEAQKHTNQYLRYWLGLELDADMAHSAAGDTFVTAHVFWQELLTYRKRMAQSDQVEELIAYAASRIPITTMPFGKHKGKPLEDVPIDYIQWALKNREDMEDDLYAALQECWVSYTTNRGRVV